MKAFKALIKPFEAPQRSEKKGALNAILFNDINPFHVTGVLFIPLVFRCFQGVWKHQLSEMEESFCEEWEDFCAHQRS